jgi:hypothetical protein
METIMAILRYCWRCQMSLPMLDETEWETIAPLLSLKTQQQACEKYYEITGFQETNINVIAHHGNHLFGPDRQQCGKPYRTPKVQCCAECGDGVTKNLMMSKD